MQWGGLQRIQTTCITNWEQHAETLQFQCTSINGGVLLSSTNHRLVALGLRFEISYCRGMIGMGPCADFKYFFSQVMFLLMLCGLLYAFQHIFFSIYAILLLNTQFYYYIHNDHTIIQSYKKINALPFSAILKLAVLAFAGGFFFVHCGKHVNLLPKNQR